MRSNPWLRLLDMPPQNSALPDEELLSVNELAEWLKVPIATIYQWNYAKSGPPRIEVGRYCRYRRGDVNQWLAALANR
jgi:predicted DNA-binding transcriptional regulator AlpA